MPLEQSGTDPQVKNALATAWKHEKSVSARTEMVTLISGGGESAGRRRRATFAGPARPATESVDEAFRHALQKAARDSEARVRVAAIRGLAALKHDARSEAILRAAWSNPREAYGACTTALNIGELEGQRC